VLDLGRHARDATSQLLQLTTQLGIVVKETLDLALKFLRLLLDLLQRRPVVSGNVRIKLLKDH